MKASALLVAGVLVAILLAGAAAALTESQAKQEFQAKGCTNCHNGALAPTFEGVIKKLQEWAKKYNSLDEAVKAEAKNFKMFRNAQSWDQLMNMMPGMTPELKQFFEQVFQQAKGGAGGAASTTTTAAPSGGAAAPATTVTTTVTQTVVKTVTQTVTEKVLITETVTPVNVEPGTGQLIAKASYVAAILVAIAALALVYVYYRK